MSSIDHDTRNWIEVDIEREVDVEEWGRELSHGELVELISKK